jgi:RimJ/RimL family protein N-acetyltransferase
MAWAQQRAGTGLPLAMEDAATGHLVGSIGIGGITNVRGAEIGYWVAAFSRGRGYAAEATAVLAAWAFGHGLHRVQLLAATGNVPSQRVAKRAGFLREGALRGAHRSRDGVPRDMVLYGRLSTDEPPSDIQRR